MTYKTTITQKGQMTIPKEVREEMGIETDSQVELEVNFEDHSIKIKKVADIMEMKGFFENKNEKDALKAREFMENNYGKK